MTPGLTRAASATSCAAGLRGSPCALSWSRACSTPTPTWCSRTTSKVTGPVLTDNDLVLPAGGLIGLVGAKGAGRYPHNRGRPAERDDAVVTPALGWMDLDGRRVSMVRG